MAEGGRQRRNHDFGPVFGSAGVYSFPSAATTNFLRLGGLKQEKFLFCFVFVFFSEFRHQNVIMAVLPPNALGRSSSLLLLACGGYQMSLLPCLSLHKAIFLLIVTIPELPPLTRIPVTGLQLTPIQLDHLLITWLHLWRPDFQISFIGSSRHEFWRDTVQPTARGLYKMSNMRWSQILKCWSVLGFLNPGTTDVLKKIC